MIVDNIRTFIKTCPLLKSGKINANHLSEKAVSYTIDNVPASPVIKKYADGATLRQFLFVFASREFYDKEALANFNVSGFYEQFAAWVDEQAKKGDLPQLRDGLIAKNIEVLTSGYLYDVDSSNARYQIQCRLVYYKGAC